MLEQRELAEPAARAAVWPKLCAEHARTVHWLKRIRGSRQLLDDNRTLRRAIRLRNPYVDPMSCRSNSFGAAVERIERALLLTLKGISAGMRNTG